MVVVLAWAKHVMRVANSQGHGDGRGARSAEAIDPLSSDGCDKGGKKNLSSGDACKTRERCWYRSSAPWVARSSSRSNERAADDCRGAISQRNVVTAVSPGLKQRTRHTESAYRYPLTHVRVAAIDNAYTRRTVAVRTPGDNAWWAYGQGERWRDEYMPYTKSFPSSVRLKNVHRQTESTIITRCETILYLLDIVATELASDGCDVNEDDDGKLARSTFVLYTVAKKLEKGIEVWNVLKRLRYNWALTPCERKMNEKWERSCSGKV